MSEKCNYSPAKIEEISDEEAKLLKLQPSPKKIVPSADSIGKKIVEIPIGSNEVKRTIINDSEYLIYHPPRYTPPAYRDPKLAPLSLREQVKFICSYHVLISRSIANQAKIQIDSCSYPEPIEPVQKKNINSAQKKEDGEYEECKETYGSGDKSDEYVSRAGRITKRKFYSEVDERKKMNFNEYVDEHSRTVIHIDLDCFYAQVEILKRPELKNVPLGIQQKNIVVTSNYVAREFGIRKCMLISEALQLCPNLVLVKGEDLTDYRTMSYKVTSLLQKYSDNVERLGLDENFIDVTKLVEQKLKNTNTDQIQSVTHVFGSTEGSCQCGCENRIKVGSVIAEEMRGLILKQIGLTSCAGVAHNKLLAKIVCSKNKPDKQTIVLPNSALELMLSLYFIENIPGIGRVTSDTLNSIGIRTIQDLQNAELSEVNKLFEIDKAKFLQNLSYGIDNTPVKRSGKPSSIGLEDSCKSICAEKEVKEKLQELLKRLILLVEADGRLPRTIKLTVRKFDKLTKTSRRETKQANINPQLFCSGAQMNPNNIEKLLLMLMNLFRRLVKVNRPFHITLLGISFIKFNERPTFRNSIAPFLRKELEVQSIISIENLNSIDSSPDSRTRSPSSCRESSDPECEPTPKRTKLGLLKKNFFEYETCESPSKLRVQDLQLSSEKQDGNQNFRCPPSIDESVFRELPLDVREELWSEYKRSHIDSASRDQNRPKRMKTANSILNYFVKK